MSTTSGTFKKLGIFVARRILCHFLGILSFFVGILFPPRRSKIPVIDDHNLITPAIKLSQQIKDGHVTSEELVESFINRIKVINPIINSVVDKRFEEALKEAREIDSKINDAINGSGDTSILKLPLVGVPMTVKETLSVDGYAYTGGLTGRKFVKAPKNSDVVDLLKKDGLIPIALTNIPELAMWWDSSNPVHGRTLNPYDLSRIPGGSSGGEAATLAAAGSVIGVGSDIAGSIRIPANFCGVFGHKPTPLVVSNVGMYPTVQGDKEKLLGVGPMTRYACDLLPMLKIMAAQNAEKLKLDEPVDLTKLKVFYIEDMVDPLASKCNSDILAGIRNAVDHLVNKYKVVAQKVTFDEFKHGLLLWSGEANSEPDETSIAKQFKDGRSGELNPSIEFVKKLFNASEHNMTSIFATSLEKYSPAHGSIAHKILTKKSADLRKKFNELLSENDVLLVPSHPEPAPKHFTTLLKVFNVSYTSMTTVLQAPITQCPLGLSEEGLPFGVQLMARPYNDRLTIAVAEEFERAFGGWTAPCRIDV